MQGVTAIENSILFNNSNNINNHSMSTLSFQKILSTLTQNLAGPEKNETFVSAEQSLKELYPGLKYQVLDASQFSYFNRLDFPTSRLYGDSISESTINELKSWKPKTQTASGYEPWVQRELEKIPNGLHVVLIHPDIQKKMEQDSEYAKQIAAKIQKYFDDDIRVNAALDPDSVKGMSQLVSITKDGEIGFHETVCDGPSANKSDENKETQTRATDKKQSLANELRNTTLSTSLPLLDQVRTASFPYNYNQLYGLLSFYQRRKIVND